MKPYQIIAVINTSIILCILCFLITLQTGPKKPVESSNPKLVMDSVCATPNGHPVYKYQDGNNTIYIVVRHSDGYPISLTVK